MAAATWGSPAAAQTALNAEPGLAGCYRGEAWMPLRVTLTQAGSPARVEVRARFRVYGEAADECRLPPRDLSGGANETHTLYLRAPESYTNQALVVDLLRDGRKVSSNNPPLRLVPPENWLICGIGSPAKVNFLNGLTTLPMPGRPGSALAGRGGSIPKMPPFVALVGADAVPEHWQALDPCDLVVLSGVGDRELRPEQATALREFVWAGGTLVVTGGLETGRLNTPLFRDLLPVRVTGSRVVDGWPGGPHGRLPLTACTLRNGAVVRLAAGSAPVVVEGALGLGKVTFVAFDPSLEPVSSWRGHTDFWAGLTQPGKAGVITALTNPDPTSPLRYGSPRGLQDVPYDIPQLDIPAFYVIALFLLAYILVLAPGNYFLLKRRDRKEWAWLTTPLIVVAFSGGAYAIGYATKGGDTRTVQAGVLELGRGQRAGRLLTYTGVFSPRRAGYILQPAAPNALLSEPRNRTARLGLHGRYEDADQILEQFDVDMWAMRVVRGESAVAAGQGLTVTAGDASSLRVRNGTPWVITECQVAWGGGATPVGTLRPGESAWAKGVGEMSGGLSPAVAANLEAAGQIGRMRRTILDAVLGFPSARSGPALVGWVADPLLKVNLNGAPPAGVSQTLVIAYF